VAHRSFRGVGKRAQDIAMSRLHARTTLAFIALFAFGCDKDTPDGPFARA
jgi:hypothetical protein